MVKRARRYREAAGLIAEMKEYEPEEAISLVKRTATAKFDETIELHLRTGADPRHADQLVRGVTVSRKPEPSGSCAASNTGAVQRRERTPNSWRSCMPWVWRAWRDSCV